MTELHPDYLPADAVADVLSGPESTLKMESSIGLLVATIEAACRREGLDDAQARRLTGIIAVDIGTNLGGQYLPMGRDLKNAVRDALIHSAAQRGASLSALAERWRLTPQRISQILARQKALYMRRHQRSLFDFDTLTPESSFED